MNTANIEKYVNRILCGKQLINHKDQLYELRCPSIDLRMKASLLYDTTYNDHIYSEYYIFEENIEDLLIELGLLYPMYQEDMHSIEKRIENIKVDLFKEFFDRTKRKKHELNLVSAQKRLNQLYQLKHSLDFLTLENYCSTVKNEFLIKNTVYYYDTDRLLFDSNNIDYQFFNSITEQITANMLDLSQMKEIARSDYWRNYYAINKNHLFSYSVVDFSDEQKALLSLSTMYDRVYEHPECPETDIIAHDDALEGWMIHQHREIKRQKKEKGVKVRGSDKVNQAGEVFLMAGSREQQKDILGLNTSESMQLIKNRIDAVSEAEGKPVQECFLPDVQQDIRQKLQAMSTAKRKG